MKNLYFLKIKAVTFGLSNAHMVFINDYTLVFAEYIIMFTCILSLRLLLNSPPALADVRLSSTKLPD
jgi:hypothetical protein